MHFSHINSLRGIAILMVILVHTTQLFNFNPILINHIFAYGKMGVQLFFIASAYTLCLSSHFRENEKKHITKFYIRRYFRIFPIYYLGILIYYLLNAYISGNTENYTFKNIVSNILFIHGLVPSANNNIVPGGWSIGTEMLFYAVFPFLFSFLSSGRSFLKGGFIILISQAILFYFQRKSNFNYEFFYFNILNQISVFLIGILFFLNKEKIKINKYLSGLFFIVFTILSIYISGKEEYYKFSFKIVPVLSAVSFCFLFIVAENSKIVNNIVFQKIGVNSYSIYIIHFILPFYFLPKMNGYIDLFFAYLLIVTSSYMVSKILNKFIEKPFIKAGNILINKI
ncbi:acyltransferase [Chryseobacterium sp. Alg-005]|uniref:acyltransferase family protein n=1 Tax=Chryseobacterium sp. Alg-005 TaxID=3159516 RepID=UPI0035559F46